jgi:polyhydroxyalkanoate synthesis regulator phasin
MNTPSALHTGDRQTGWRRWLIVSAVWLLLASGLAAVAPLPAQAAADPAPAARRGPAPEHTHGDEQLAQALGISVEELQAARDKARAAAIDKLVADGWLTERQAERVRARGLDHFPELWHMDTGIDPDALLADALGITVEELDAARQTAFGLRLDEAVSAGKLTPDEAETLKARHAFGGFLRARLRILFEGLVQDAVAEGALTQEQADRILSGEGLGFLGRRLHRWLIGPGW